MAESVSLDPDELRATAKNLADLSSQMKDVLSSLTSAVDSLGAPWGGDDPGKKFADGDNGYLAQKDSVVKAVDQKTSLLDMYADNLRTAADTLEQQDDQ